MKVIETPIQDLVIALNKVVGDQRGYLAEMAPGGLSNPYMSKGFGNLYASVATGKHVARAGHYHFIAWENHYTLTGTALWLFTDFRKDSTSFGKSVEIIAGGKTLNPSILLGVNSERSRAIDLLGKNVLHYPLDQQVMAQVYCGPGINHIVWPLTDEPVIIVDATSEPYNKEDYAYPKLTEIPGIEKILDKYGISL